MAMSYHLTGVVSTLFFLLTLGGLCDQIRVVWQRRRAWDEGRSEDETPTSILSLNQFTMSFLAFFSYFVYGFCLERFNHYLVWPRLVALCLVLIILFEIARDRRGWGAVVTFGGCLIATAAGLTLLASGLEIGGEGRRVAQMLVVVAAVLLIQAAQMLLQAEGIPIVKADSLEDAVAVEQAVVEDRKAGLVDRHQFSIQPACCHCFQTFPKRLLHPIRSCVRRNCRLDPFPGQVGA